MIWYFLYPFRGTTEAPILAPTHPLRNAFTRYGRYAARHVVSTLLISVTVAAILIYPFPFLFTTDFTNGASNLPHHVWTAAQPLGHRSRVEPDVIMRSIWVHGSYMKALDRQVLLGALELQDALLGPTKNFSPRRSSNHVAIRDPLVDLTLDERDTFHVINGLSNSSWFFHSPLQYWSCDSSLIEADEDIVSTVNQKKTQPTSVKVTLRHSIVFSGKRFEDRQLLAADAIVITLIHRHDSPVAQQWIRKAQDIARTMADKWDIYPPDGIATEPELYEFQFRPISTQDTIILVLAYGLSFLYVIMSLSRLRAFKSKIGLIITVVVQNLVSILSSFTICAIFRVDLSRIPQAAYPVVVLAMSLENVFRLINAVISTPAEENTSTRIGNAFGETAPIGLASSLQNVFYVWGLSQITSSGVSEFCTFAAIAIVFDYFYLSTFFLSVLSVDVRRTELSDALAKAAAWQSKNSNASQQRPSWIDSMLQGRLALSTRIAGTIVMVGFVLIAQWHFFENEFLYRLFTGVFNFSREADSVGAKESLLIDIHQARSPTSWLRLQDHDTAKEVINVIKPHAHSYIAQVYRPLVFVLKGSNREPDIKDGPLLPALYDFFHHQLTPFIVTVLVVIAAVRLLTNYLLLEEEMDPSADDGGSAEPLLSVKYLDRGHNLDVVMMVALSTQNGNQLVSVGLDRHIRVWDIRLGVRSYEITALRPPAEDPFPILSMAVDRDGHWLALLSVYQIFLWNLGQRRWGPTVPVDLYGQKPDGFFFGNTTTGGMKPLIIVRRNGTMSKLWPETRETMDFVLCETPLVSAWPLVQKSTAARTFPLRIITASRKGCIHVATEVDDAEWHSESVNIPHSEKGEIYQVLPLASIEAFLVIRSRSIDLINMTENEVVHTFETEAMQPRSLRCYHPAPRSATVAGGAAGVSSLSLAYVNSETSECVLHTFLPSENTDLISTRASAVHPGRTYCSWLEAKEVKKRIANPGAWEMLANGCMVGVRKAIDAKANGHKQDGATRGGLRQRLNKAEPASKGGPDAWEVWALSRLGMRSVYETMALEPRDGRLDGLMFTKLGPVVKVGTAAMAVAFGNDIRVISAGHDWSADDTDGAGIGPKLRRLKRTGGGSTRLRAAT